MIYSTSYALIRNLDRVVVEKGSRKQMLSKMKRLNKIHSRTYSLGLGGELGKRFN